MKVICNATTCKHNKDKECTKEVITLYTGADVKCDVCDNEFEHDLCDCADYERNY